MVVVHSPHHGASGAIADDLSAFLALNDAGKGLGGRTGITVYQHNKLALKNVVAAALDHQGLGFLAPLYVGNFHVMVSEVTQHSKQRDFCAAGIASQIENQRL